MNFRCLTVQNPVTVAGLLLAFNISLTKLALSSWGRCVSGRLPPFPSKKR